jgi:hypothetical protein
MGNILGVKVCRGAPAVSHLLLADDSLILMRADASNAVSLKRALDDYCAASGQQLSDAKSSIFFSPCTDVNTKVEVFSILNIMTEAITNKYLGLPPLVGLNRTDCFQHLIDRTCKILSGWKRGTYKSRYSSYSCICDVSLLAAQADHQRDDLCNVSVLVGR